MGRWVPVKYDTVVVQHRVVSSAIVSSSNASHSTIIVPWLPPAERSPAPRGVVREPGSDHCRRLRCPASRRRAGGAMLRTITTLRSCGEYLAPSGGILDAQLRHQACPRLRAAPSFLRRRRAARCGGAHQVRLRGRMARRSTVIRCSLATWWSISPLPAARNALGRAHVPIARRNGAVGRVCDTHVRDCAASSPVSCSLRRHLPLDSGPRAGDGERLPIAAATCW